MSQVQPIEVIQDEEQVDILIDEGNGEDQMRSSKDLIQKNNQKEFDWMKYKTEKCTDKECIVQIKKKDTLFPLLFECERWHNITDRRRNIIMKDKNKFNYCRLYVKDYDKEDTRYCMNFFEYLYHPQNFRSRECPSVLQTAVGNIEENQNNQKEKSISCIYGFYCPYYHTQQEKNDWVNDLKLTKFMTAPKEKFTQSLLDDFNNIQSSNKQLEKLFEQTITQKQQQMLDKQKSLNTQKENSSEQPTSQQKIDLQLSEQNYKQISFNISGRLQCDFDDNVIEYQKDENDDPHSKSETEEKPSKTRDNKRNQGNSKYSPKSKTMINLDKENQSTKKIEIMDESQYEMINDQKQDDILEYNKQMERIENTRESMNKQMKQDKIKNKRIEQLQDQSQKIHSLNSLNINEFQQNQELEIIKQISKCTDLSSNDEYLKDISDTNNQRVKYTYTYKQDLGHESSTVEFKNYQKLSTCKIQKDMNGILKLQEYGQYICGFLNHKGGTMYIGVHDEGWVDGISLNSKQKDWFNQHIDFITSQIEPRLVVGEVRINYVEVLGKSNQNLPKDSRNYVIELQVVKTNYSDIYFYDNNAFIKKQSSLTKMSMGEINIYYSLINNIFYMYYRQDLLVKIKKQQKAESNFIQKLFMYDDTSELDSYSELQLQKLEEKLQNVLRSVKNRLIEKRGEN